MGFIQKPLWKTYNTWSGEIYVFAKDAVEAATKVNKHLKADAKANGCSDYELVTRVEQFSVAVLA